MRPTTRAVVVNLPHNPTGMHLGAAEFDALAELVERHGATLVCDEVYRGLEQDPAAPAARGRRLLAPRRQRRRALEVVRAGRPARGLAGDARPRAAGRRRAGARLHVALQPGAVRGARRRRAARRGGPDRAQPRHHRGQPAARRRADGRARRASSTGCGPRRARSASRAIAAREGIDAFNERLVERAGRAAAAGPRVRLRRRALPPRASAARTSPRRSSGSTGSCARERLRPDRRHVRADAPPRSAHRAADRRRARRRAQRRQRRRRRRRVRAARPRRGRGRAVGRDARAATRGRRARRAGRRPRTCRSATTPSTPRWRC